MKHGSKILLSFLFLILSFYNLIAEEKITSTPLINLNEVKPSFEESDDKNDNINYQQNIKNRKQKKLLSSPHAVLIGLDKITAKSLQIKIKINEIKKFGPLEIKILKCGKIQVNNKFDDVAYMQVKDLSKNDNEKVFIFNGWTFASEPSLTPFDHAIYDLQLINCYNV